MREPKRPDVSGNVFVVFMDDEVKGWRDAMTAYQAASIAFDHPEHPRYKALIWEHCKLEWCHTALEEGRIEGKIREGCPDCAKEIARLKQEIIDRDSTIDSLTSENVTLRAAFQKQGENSLLLKSRRNLASRTVQEGEELLERRREERRKEDRRSEDDSMESLYALASLVTEEGINAKKPL